MADININITAVNTGGKLTIVQQATGVPVQPVIKVLVQGPQGPPGSSIGFNSTELAVVSNGQTEFNVTSIPTQSFLYVNGIEHYFGIDYDFITSGANKHLRWINTFYQLSTTDYLILKYS